MGGPTLTPSEVAVGYVTAFAAGDPDRIADWVTDDFVNEHTAALGSGCAGRDAYRQRLPEFLSAFDGLAYDVERTIADGDEVALCYRMTALSSGSPVNIRGVMVIETRDGYVSRRTDYWDALTYLRQTGQG